VAVITLSRKIHPLVPGVLLAAVGGMAFSILTDYQGSTVGDVPSGFPPLTVDLPWASLPTLVLPGLVIALVGFAEAASISRVFASEDREHWNPDREFLSQGAANVVAGLSGGFPVGGSFSRSSLNRMAGAGSRWSGLITGLGVIAFLPFASLLSPLPRAILSGIVIAAIWSLFKPGVLIEMWRLSKAQALVGMSTFVLTLALAPHVEHAVLVGILTAGAVHLWKELKPGVVGRRDGETLHLELEGVLWFGSAPALDDAILRRLSDERDVTKVVIHLGGLGRIDLTGAYTLSEMLEQLRGAGIEVEVREVPEHARRIFKVVEPNSL
jgi:SulP family sulfate permease